MLRDRVIIRGGGGETAGAAQPGGAGVPAEGGAGAGIGAAETETAGVTVVAAWTGADGAAISG